eukprot:TRINITY_DN2620_c0_g1_i2.p1 TRINITY_DN2620_c0_g1~~TRINITY_DN2620_c0_g1_i2.p1  ORF type:complete len:339 (-),score=177.07 TRINITY_DN2620_c0_g1_i2:95-1111(-)
MSTNKKVIRWGILGTASISKTNVKAMHQCDIAEVRAIASRDLLKAQAFAKEENVPIAYGSYEELLNDPEIDAVYIPLPTNMHVEWVTKTAQKGKHVLCDKPTASSVEELKQMIEVCKQNNVLFMDGVMWSHHPRTTLIKENLHRLGQILRVNSTFDWRQLDPNNIRLNPVLEPLGALGDLGWYCIRACILGFGSELPEKVVGFGQWNENGALIAFTGVIFYSGGRSCSFECSFLIGEYQAFEICGSEAILRCEDFVWPFGEKREDYVSQFEIHFPLGKTEVIKIDRPIKHEEELIRDFSAIVLSGKRETNWEELTLLNQTILNALLESAKTNKPVLLK